ncbi:hypothetical protein PSEUBRA_004215 [Kalmanozyma brasiliensis GHG001]|uniref:uncharacterized protein n=1 Tax=Kalmanozyma brasiliensis (strain GHG001) TaxID=1365824 RepID=UPI0028682C32|nr:uncharacterized protein PSEUBRA_004215 [Kalmanozyma brasiliensis GHG001]KAF6767354.1 hypothetical protein PSEUBRA_004215 [Kalmanozyma brasiliensis GHG001]
MTDESQRMLGIASRLADRHVEAALVPLPDSPNVSVFGPTETSTEVTPSLAVANEHALSPVILTERDHMTESLAEPKAVLSSMLQSPERKQPSSTKPMSPEKAALAAMFDSIKMPPPPASPSKSPRKASGSSILSSPSKQVAKDAAPVAASLFRYRSSPTTSPSRIASTDSAVSRHFSRDSPVRRPVVISSSSSPGKGASDGKNASTPLSPASATASAGSRAPRMRPSMFASSSSPSAKLSDLTLNLDTTGTQELIFKEDASFLAAVADVTVDDSFDVSRAKARIASSTTRKGSPAKFGRAKPRCSVVPEDDVAEIKPRSPRKRGDALGVGRVVKNAAGDDTIELNLTGSFMGNASMIGGNLMDESAEASLLLGNSFSLSQSHLLKRDLATKQTTNKKERGIDGEEDDDEEGEDYERDTQNMQKWAAEAARKAQLGRKAVDKTTSRSTFATRSGSPTVTRPSIGSATVTKPVSRIAPRHSLVTPTATSRLLKPRASGISTVKAEPAMSRSGSASSGLSSSSTTAVTSSTIHLDSTDTAEAKTPMRSRRKSTFTTSRPPVSGPARRRESLAASAIIQSHPIPPLPSLGSTSPGRARAASTSTTTGSSPSMKTPSAATRTIAKPRTSLTGRTVIPTPRSSAPVPSAGAVGASRVGSVARPRTSLTGATPTARTATVRSASLVTPTARTAAARTVEPVQGMRRSTSQPHIEEGKTPVARTRMLVPRASLSTASRLSIGGLPRTAVAPRTSAFSERAGNNASVQASMEGGSKIGTVGTRRPSITGGFGFKPRTSAVFVGRSSLLDSEDKEN